MSVGRPLVATGADHTFEGILQWPTFNRHHVYADASLQVGRILVIVKNLLPVRREPGEPHGKVRKLEWTRGSPIDGNDGGDDFVAVLIRDPLPVRGTQGNRNGFFVGQLHWVLAIRIHPPEVGLLVLHFAVNDVLAIAATRSEANMLVTGNQLSRIAALHGNGIQIAIVRLVKEAVFSERSHVGDRRPPRGKLLRARRIARWQRP